ncbi:MAG: hypothetical protein A2341_01830 [Deltaproteobacteria bacterium RIFOXYB12_FULL_58_9]|nr:MAG: hypothetical protein A2341_01830 [Deltaproteobacteria bacterium RIFOXYB12_FULL_58_9]
MTDRVLTAFTPRCPNFEDAHQAQLWSDRTRTQLIELIGLEPQRDVITAQVQRVVPGTEFRIDVVRIEVFKGIFMSANVYVPSTSSPKIPLVMAPSACGTALWDTRVQRRAANLAMLGMTVVVSEGFCANGVRASLPESRRHVDYSRQMLGLQGSAFTAHIQEQVSTLNWALAQYENVDGDCHWR